MNYTTISIDIPSDLLVALNETEQELKDHFQLVIALTLFQEKKLTLGKAIQLSGLSRYEFEREMAKRKIPVAALNVDQIAADVANTKN